MDKSQIQYGEEGVNAICSTISSEKEVIAAAEDSKG